MAHSTTASARGGARLYNRIFRDVKATSTTNFRFLQPKAPFIRKQTAHLGRLGRAVHDKWFRDDPTDRAGEMKQAGMVLPGMRMTIMDERQ
jgi:hypothetical protein